MKRTLTKQAIEMIGEKIMIQGWVDTVRDHGKVAFVDLRDRSGIVQVVGGKDVGSLGSEYVVEIIGIVKKRPDHLINKNISTGEIEIESEKVTILNKSKEIPLPINTDGYDIDEVVRLKYRYLDLRRPRLQSNIQLRSKFIQYIREFLFKNDFTEIETPLLTKSTPEGSRDFLVPSRLQPGKFYALPQSPQQYKQLLMTAGFEKYFQLARAVRDEDLRADRGFEHTQIDLEMSFVDQKDVMELVEKMVISSVEAVEGKIINKPFPVFTYDEAMEKYGADKFDMRTKEQKEDNQLAFAWVVSFPFFEKTKEGEWTFTHNPFSHPHPEHVQDLLDKKNIDKILTAQYDLVCNGFEVGGGSIRAHKPEILKSVFEIIGHSSEEIEEQFGHMLSAFELGTPPHGGIALGVERLIMILSGEKYLREVQAFPQTSSGQTAVMNAPSIVQDSQLGELGISTHHDPSTQSENPHQNLSGYLKKLNIKTKLYKHKPVKTSEEAAKERKTDIKQGAKALVMMADKKPILVVVSAATKMDFNTFKKLYHIKDLRMSSPKEALDITGIEIGAIHPIGSLYKIDTYVDEKLSANRSVIFNAGNHTTSFEILYEDFLRATQPILGKFSK